MDSDFFSLREVGIESREVATDDGWRADYCEGGLWEGGRRVSERESFKREIDDSREGVYADMGNDEDGFRREEIVEGKEMGVSTSAKTLLCADGVGEEALFAVTHEIWLPGEEEEVEGGRETDQMAEMGFPWRVGLDRSVALIVS